MRDTELLVKQVDLFADLDSDSLELLLAHSRILNFRKNAVLMTEGESGECMYIIQSGSIRIYVSDENGNELTVFVQGAGSYIGEISLLDDSPRTASAIALEQTSVLLISKAAFCNCIENNPQIAFKILKAVTQRLRKATNDIRNLALKNIYQRLADKLIELSIYQDGVRQLPRKYSQQELANMIGASREMVGRILSDLSSSGYIGTQDSRYQLLKDLPHDW